MEVDSGEVLRLLGAMRDCARHVEREIREHPPAGVALAAFLAGGMWFALLIPSVTNGAVARVPPLSRSCSPFSWPRRQ